MRVAIDAHVITGKYQGTRTTLKRLITRLGALTTDHRFYIYFDDNDGGLARDEIARPPFAFRNLSGIGTIRRLTYAFARLLSRDDIDVAIFQYNIPFFVNTKTIVFIHDILPITHPHYFPFLNRFRTRILFNISVRRASIIATVSDYSAQAISSYYKLPLNRVRTIHNGPSFNVVDYWRNPVQPQQNRYILAVGRIERRKNMNLLVRAFNAAKLDNLELVIVGKQDLDYSLDHILAEGVKMRTDVSDGDLIDLYRSASLFVYPSAAEGFGIPLLDALLFGIPTISSDQTSMREIGEGIASMFDPTLPESEQVLTAMIRSHFLDTPIPSATQAQQTDLHRRFNWDTAAVQLVEIVDSMEVAN